MSQAVFNAIEAKDISALENSLLGGASPECVNAEGKHPLSLVASLIQRSFADGAFEDEDLYKKMAAVLIVNGAPRDDLKHACGEVSNLCRYICRYTVDLATQIQESDRVVELIQEERIWFEGDQKVQEKNFLEAVEKGQKDVIGAMFEKGLVHTAYEQ